tara:strand:- start:412 stop:1203 length:792 start_codon:yes stop_codon:yes gene_type:complete
MLAILDEFSESQLTIDVARAAERCGSSRASTYRYLQALTRAGLLTPSSGGTYTIGSRVIELEMLKRENDPLLRAGRSLIRFSAEEMGLNIMLCSYYGDKVLCADFAWPDHSIPEIYKQGRPMPIFRGAMAKVILANLSVPQLKTIYAHNSTLIDESALGSDLRIFLTKMGEIKSAGYCITHAEVFDGLVGVAAPVNDGEERVLGSVVFVVSRDRYNGNEPSFFIEQIKYISSEIERRIQRDFGKGEATTMSAPRPGRAPVYKA